MKFALVNGERLEAQPNLSGKCPACDQTMNAKCGPVKIWHWAHKGRHTCDPWCENETEWHRTWKGHFPKHWQEIVHRADNGEKHIADVKTDQGWVIEFQNSPIKSEERQSRDAFYDKLVWVVNGERLQRDPRQFFEAGYRAKSIVPNLQIWRTFSDECAILRECVGDHGPVFLDFKGERELWWIRTGLTKGSAYIARSSRIDFIERNHHAAPPTPPHFDEL